MSVTGNTVFPLPDAESADLCKRLGLALGNAAMYGMEHAVTAASQAAAYQVLIALLDLYSEIEWCLLDDALLMNGKPVDTSRGTAQVLVEQMRRGNIHNFAFCSPFERREFSSFLSILSAEPGSALIEEGVDAAVAKADFKSIRVDKAVYERVGKKGAEKKEMPAETMAATGAGGRAAGGHSAVKAEKSRVFDLDSEYLSLDEGDVSGGVPSTFPGALDIAAQAAHYLEKRREIMREHSSIIDMVKRCAKDPASLDALREALMSSGVSAAEWSVLLSESGVDRDGGGIRDDAKLEHLLASVETLAAQRSAGNTESRSMANALESISREVHSLIQRTQGQAATLAQRVDADRDTVAELERKARDSGVGLQLYRQELLGSLAEINQELVQPLTTSTALLQMLSSGKIGAVTDEQRDVLKMASEGMERLEKLIMYLQRISGFPVELSPDSNLLSEVYR